jgi:hypothetical protein
MAGHHEDAVVRFLPHRRLSPQRIEVRVRIVLHGSIAEEVHGFEIGHECSVSAQAASGRGDLV